MARHNNTSRSLIIMSKMQGWDPTEIVGPAMQYDEDKVRKGTRTSFPGGHEAPSAKFPAAMMKQAPPPTNAMPHTTNANPFPDMPGASDRSGRGE